jgi:PAS domain S-box-containing protein
MVLILKNAPRVLVIESDLEMQRKVTQMLAADYATGVATDAASAFILHNETPADLVLANIMAGARDGATVGEIQKHPQFNPVPVIVYSSAGREEVCLALMDSGINDYLIAPFTADQLLARVRAQLRASQKEEFRANFELAGIGQAQVDPNTGRFLRVNPRFCEMVGYAADELLNLTFFDITYSGDLEHNTASWLHFMRGGSNQYTIEKRYVRKDGSIIWGEITATMLRDAEGQPLRTVSMIQDITERRLSETVFQSQKSALEMVAQGASLNDVLQFVVASLQKQAHESLVVSILLLDRGGENVSLGAASGLPARIQRKLRNGVAVGDLTGPCRLVFLQKQPAFVPDVNADPDW